MSGKLIGRPLLAAADPGLRVRARKQIERDRSVGSLSDLPHRKNRLSFPFCGSIIIGKLWKTTVFRTKIFHTDWRTKWKTGNEYLPCCSPSP